MEVKSEIFREYDYSSVSITNGNVISKYRFNMPTIERDEKPLEYDNENDLVVQRKRNEIIEIEHKKSSKLSEVGLQLWRGAFLLNDFILSTQHLFNDKIVLELGSGVGITSIVASIVAKKVLCTDINIAGILDLIKRNLKLNSHYQRTKNNIEVHELDFFAEKWSDQLELAIKDVDICLAADVIYENDITNGLIKSILKLFNKSKKLKEMYMALEKRYVFTDKVLAPMYECFIRMFSQQTAGILKISECPTDFPQYFEYDRCKELVLFRITKI
ncbi:hypothetical protein PVAND_008289 [Polypedilum vanderplanki]|uniref:Methyltransferase-like protein 22 n=1 Tax=Polypedilum vanderplanki TaxID=319348 RepID=A0A9J6C966_POLVA|nr:hypothetical protein PVAND_008289 [Polypedilum vanderplanki]